jgi:glutamine synthetase
VQGSPIEFSEGLEFPDSLLLKPDLSTVKEVPWQKKEAMLFADPYSPDT